MDNGRLYRRRQAKAVAISRAIEAGRKAVIAKAVLAAAAVAIVVETLSLAHRMWTMSHP